MNKLKTIIQYECATSFKYIWLFYAIQYTIVTLISIIIGISVGTFENVGTNCLEINSLIYVGILGVLGFKEDFRMLLQNGFTRKYIFIATFSLFCFISGIMALTDTLTGNLIHSMKNSYFSLYGGLYEYGNLLINWLWLFLLYTFICSFFYCMILIFNVIGKTAFLSLGILLGGIILLIAALFRYVFSSALVKHIGDILMNAMGFMKDGSVNHLFPLLTLLSITFLFGIASFSVIRRTELR